MSPTSKQGQNLCFGTFHGLERIPSGCDSSPSPAGFILFILICSLDLLGFGSLASVLEKVLHVPSQVYLILFSLALKEAKCSIVWYMPFDKYLPMSTKINPQLAVANLTYQHFYSLLVKLWNRS